MGESKMKTKAKWLHISDLHIFPEADTRFMIDDYRELAQVISPQFLIVTGDFRHKSRKTEFSLARKYLEELLDIFHIDKSDVFLIPGNHDVNEYEGRSNSILDIRQHSEINDYDFYSLYQLNKGFADYKNFVREFYKDSTVVDARIRCPEQVMCITWNNLLNIVMLNTALISDGKRHGEIIDINALSQCKMDSNKPSIIIGHHGLESLYPCYADRIKVVIDRRKISAYLHGDGHRYANRPVSKISTPNITIPSIACAKSAPQSGDQYSDIGIVYYEWQTDDNTYVQAYRWSSGGFIEDSTYYHNINKKYYFPMIYNEENKQRGINISEYNKIKICDQNLVNVEKQIVDVKNIQESIHQEDMSKEIFAYYYEIASEGGLQMKNFVGRKYECNYFNSILSDFLEEYASEYVKENPVKSQSVLDVYGVGGIGKTSLLKQMLTLTQEKTTEKDYLFSVYIDTSGYDNFVEVLYRIRSKIKEQYDDTLICQTDFFEFDSVYTLFYGQDKKNVISRPLIRDIIHEIIQNIELFDFLSIDVFNTMKTIEIEGMKVVTGSLAQNVIGGIIRALPIFYSTARIRRKLRIEQEDLEAKLREIRDNVNSVYQREEYLLAKFIEGAEKIADNFPMIFFIDNLQSEGDYGNLLKNYTWLTGTKGIIAKLPAFYVLGSRDSVKYLLNHMIENKKIRYEEINLQGVTIDEIKLFYQKACGLDFGDTLTAVEEKMLKAALIKENTDQHQLIVQDESGNYSVAQYLPMIMKLASDYYNQLKENKKKKGDENPVTVEELGAIDKFEDLSYYFEINLSNTTRDVFYILSCINVWDEKWFKIVKERFNNYLLNAVHVLRSFSSLEALDYNKIKIHDLVRQYLHDSPKNIIKLDVQEWLFLYFLHMQDVLQMPEITFLKTPAVIDNLGDLSVFAYVGMNYIQSIKDKEYERFTCERAMRYFQQAFRKSLILYESPETVNEEITGILEFLINRVEEILPGSIYGLDYRREQALMYSYLSYNVLALEESKKLVEQAEEQVKNVPTEGRDYDNFVKVYSDRGNAYNSLAYDMGETWDYGNAAPLGFKAVKEQYNLLREAEPYLALSSEEKEAYETILDMCQWGNYKCDEKKLKENAEILKGSVYYQTREQGKVDGILWRYLKSRGNIPWYYLRLPVAKRESLGEFDPVQFGLQTYQLRKAFYGINSFTLRSRHNVSVYLKLEKHYKDALLLSDKVYKEGYDNLKISNKKIPDTDEIEKKLEQLKSLGLIEADRIEEIFNSYKELLSYDNLQIEILQYNSNFNLCNALESGIESKERSQLLMKAQEKGEAAVVLRWITLPEKADSLLTSWSFLASDYYAEGKYHAAVSIIKYVIRHLEETENRIGVNEYKLEEHKIMLYEMEKQVWSEDHRYIE